MNTLNDLKIFACNAKLTINLLSSKKVFVWLRSVVFELKHKQTCKKTDRFLRIAYFACVTWHPNYVHLCVRRHLRIRICAYLCVYACLLCFGLNAHLQPAMRIQRHAT